MLERDAVGGGGGTEGVFALPDPALRHAMLDQGPGLLLPSLSNAAAGRSAEEAAVQLRVAVAAGLVLRSLVPRC